MTVPLYWRHLERGSIYEEVGPARLQTARPLGDMAHLTVYRSIGDASLWARPDAEFLAGGKFERVDPPNPLPTAHRLAPIWRRYRERAAGNFAGLPLEDCTRDDLLAVIGFLSSPEGQSSLAAAGSPGRRSCLADDLSGSTKS